MSGAPGVSALDHVLVLSDDIERSREFYEGTLGLRAGPRQLFCFDPDGARVEINVPANDPEV